MSHSPDASVLRSIHACRSCGGEALIPVLDLGMVSLANALVTPEAHAGGQVAPAFPLTLVFCPGCTLMQIRETVDPELLFSTYCYFSSFSDAMLAHAQALADRLVAERALTAESLVVEVASNDGYLLKNFVAHGIPVLGIEPARNIAATANEAGVRTRVAYFGRDLAHALREEGCQADILIGNNVLAHVEDINGFVAGVAHLLADDGRGVFEFPYVGDLLAHTEFDTIYHEHLCYYSLHAVHALFSRHGLAVVDVERLTIHGGSLRIFVAPDRCALAPSAAVAALLAAERDDGLTISAAYASFGAQVESLCALLRGELSRRKAAGERLAAYGASAKGTTLLATLGIGRETLDFVVDRSAIKQGHFTPGTDLEILPPAALLDRQPDAVLLLTWNFADEILRQQAEYLARGGTFVIPLPSPRLVRHEGESPLRLISAPEVTPDQQERGA